MLFHVLDKIKSKWNKNKKSTCTYHSHEYIIEHLAPSSVNKNCFNFASEKIDKSIKMSIDLYNAKRMSVPARFRSWDFLCTTTAKFENCWFSKIPYLQILGSKKPNSEIPEVLLDRYDTTTSQAQQQHPYYQLHWTSSKLDKWCWLIFNSKIITTIIFN